MKRYTIINYFEIAGDDDDDHTNSIEEQVDVANFTIETTFNKILKVFGHEINEEDWQKLDQKLALLGFKHSFFEVSVVKDPENHKRNIIRVSMMFSNKYID